MEKSGRETQTSRLRLQCLRAAVALRLDLSTIADNSRLTWAGSWRFGRMMGSLRPCRMLPPFSESSPCAPASTASSPRPGMCCSSLRRTARALLELPGVPCRSLRSRQLGSRWLSGTNRATSWSSTTPRPPTRQVPNPHPPHLKWEKVPSSRPPHPRRGSAAPRSPHLQRGTVCPPWTRWSDRWMTLLAKFARAAQPQRAPLLLPP
mmetsp:Transcript_63657/g.165402  ORF Transcript_63657/g.165402 Transcript_63657/m.165402 type:complete len:206 (-) Transcript_63657:1376-1993(-)